MIDEAQDFLQESMALYDLLAPLADADYAAQTQFKGWTINQVVQHLHFFNLAAVYSLQDPAHFREVYGRLQRKRQAGISMAHATDDLLDGVHGQALLQQWRTGFEETAAAFTPADPRQRVPWAGPDMSARSSICARLMETWAHGQEVYDHLGVVRQNTDRIRGIAVIGVNTYDWTFRNRGEDAPQPKPYVALESPSGALWQWGEPSDVDSVEGLAEEFCQVVTQVRNVQDTCLRVRGDSATKWMAMAQCFAGPAQPPPPPGTRGPRTTTVNNNS